MHACRRPHENNVKGSEFKWTLVSLVSPVKCHLVYLVPLVLVVLLVGILVLVVVALLIGVLIVLVVLAVLVLMVGVLLLVIPVVVLVLPIIVPPVIGLAMSLTIVVGVVLLMCGVTPMTWAQLFLCRLTRLVTRANRTRIMDPPWTMCTM